jgi:predicted component of type VI protein secretion system
MRRIARRLAVLFAATLVMGCTPETSTPPPTEPAQADVILKPDSAKDKVGANPKKKKLPVPSGSPRTSSVKPNPNL